MRNLSLIIVLVALATISSARYNSFGSFFRRNSPLEMLLNADKNDGDVAGGWNCAICTILVYESEIYSTVHNETIDQFLENDLCKLFKSPLNSLCVGFINEYGADIIDALKNDSSPDDACLKVGLCNNPQCRAVPKNNSTMTLRFSTPEDLPLLPTPKKFDPFAELMKILEEFTNNHRPDVDFDNDTYSEFTAQARGFNWKGKDCDDLDKNVHPGVAVGKDPAADFSCNGIRGRNESNNIPWRQALCNNTNMLGMAVVGDSVGAHFELPPQWFNGSAWNSSTFDDFIPRALDEFDLPEYSGWTGYLTNLTYSHSLYQYLFNQNHCNMRDYQNAGVNGATSYNVIPDVTDGSFRRDQQNDNPVLLILELVGNDVCAGWPEYTNVTDFQNNLMDILNFFDTMLPTGSHVVLVGLANGSLLYEYMWNQTHPTGLTYVDVYDYLMCLGISPCPGWLNSNDTTRANTTAQAVALTQVLENIASSGQTWNHFDLAFYDFPANTIMNAWVAQGNNPVELIEPVDGFHPSQIFHSLMADWFWEQFQANQSSWLGSPNPNNALITQLFGDQGGYGY